MDKKDEMMIASQEEFLTKIYTIRGQKVMLDFELAEIYGYETKTFNQQVKIILRNLMVTSDFNLLKRNGYF